MEDMIYIVVLSALFGSAMKVADCFNEHEFKWFKGDALLFGVLFGLAGGGLMFFNSEVLNLYLALLLVNILRFRVDSFNHGVAAVIMFFAFLLNMDRFNWQIFNYFFFAFAMFGLIMDLNLFSLKNKFFIWFLERRIFYFLLALLFSIYTQIWVVFISMFLFQLSYNVASTIAQKSPHYVK